MTAEAASSESGRPGFDAGIFKKWWFWVGVGFVISCLIGYDTYEREDGGYQPVLGFLGDWAFGALRYIFSPIAVFFKDLGFALELSLQGLLVGVLYSLVALGFVLIYKASGMFNYSQGVMVLFAALTFVGITEFKLSLAPASGLLYVWIAMAAVGAVLLSGYFLRARARPVGADLESLPAATRTVGIIGYGLVYWGAGMALWYLLTDGGPGVTGTIIVSVFTLLAMGLFLLRAQGRIGWGAGGDSFTDAGRAILQVILFVALILAIVAIWTTKTPVYVAIPLTIIVMIAFAYTIEAMILRHLVNQEQIILFMATIGLAFFLEGFGDTLWGSNVKPMPIKCPSVDTGNFFDIWGGMFSGWVKGEDFCLPTGRYEAFTVGSGDSAWTIGLQSLDVAAAVLGAILVIGLAIFFNKTRIGRALRAVADDHQAALSVGINLRTIWIIVWAVAGIVALFAGIVWGAPSGVQFSLSLIALKALPVLLIGGFESIPGVIVAGLIVGFGEKIAEVTWGAAIGGAIENWFAFMLAMVFLVIRPQGLFGEKIIERV